MLGDPRRPLRERDLTGEPALFHSVFLPIGRDEATSVVGRQFPQLVPAMDGETVLYHDGSRWGNPVAATLHPTPTQDGRPGTWLRFRLAYRTSPPLSMPYGTGLGRQIHAALAEYAASRYPASPPPQGVRGPPVPPV